MSDSNKRIDPELVSVERLFFSSVQYIVPRYQRGYAWEKEQVEQLLDDVYQSFSDSPNDEYLLGQIITCPSESPLRSLNSEYTQYDLIDGQQRCTTLYLILVALWHRVSGANSENLGKRTGGVLEGLVSHLIERDDRDLVVPKLKPAANGNQLFEALVNGMKLPSELEGPTAKNIVSAWAQINEFLEARVKEGTFKGFSTYLRQKVLLIRLHLADSIHALRVFSKVNNRGLTLDDADLIKSYLFQKVQSDEDFASLSAQWDEASNTMFKSRWKKTQSMEYLLKLKAGIETGDSVSSGKIFETWESLLSDEAKARGFAASLPGDATAVSMLTNNKVKQYGGEYCDLNYFTNMRKVVQHYEVLVAGSHLAPGPYDRLNRIVQARTTLATLAGEAKEYERLIHPWAHAIRSLREDSSAAEVTAACDSVGARANLDREFDLAFIRVQSLRYDVQSHQELLRFVLASVARYVQGLVDSSLPQLRSYMETTTGAGEARGFDMDHIFPKSTTRVALHLPRDDSWQALGDEERLSRERSMIHSIGNLVLLHPADNRNQSDALPSEESKISNFSQSQLLANRLLVTKPENLGSPRIRKAADELGPVPSLEGWDEKSVQMRADWIWRVFGNILRGDMQLT
ncbi:MAG TPA: DUF262 domain-containing protein [Microbacteriaceae bacterium]|nr:DUF262 domain-containing protein [Microbacteriaceae bacterium]